MYAEKAKQEDGIDVKEVLSRLNDKLEVQDHKAWKKHIKEYMKLIK